MKQLVLASTSPFRKSLLEKLAVPFITDAPHTDETPHADEPPERLAASGRGKAHAMWHRGIRRPDHRVGPGRLCRRRAGQTGQSGKRDRPAVQASGRAVNFIPACACWTARPAGYR